MPLSDAGFDTIRATQLSIPELDQLIDTYRRRLAEIDGDAELTAEAKLRRRSGVIATTTMALDELQRAQLSKHPHVAEALTAKGTILGRTRADVVSERELLAKLHSEVQQNNLRQQLREATTHDEIRDIFTAAEMAHDTVRRTIGDLAARRARDHAKTTQTDKADAVTLANDLTTRHREWVAEHPPLGEQLADADRAIERAKFNVTRSFAAQRRAAGLTETPHIVVTERPEPQPV